jgi:predicted protein tyrosine phosphatase
MLGAEPFKAESTGMHISHSNSPVSPSQDRALSGSTRNMGDRQVAARWKATKPEVTPPMHLANLFGCAFETEHRILAAWNGCLERTTR